MVLRARVMVAHVCQRIWGDDRLPRDDVRSDCNGAWRRDAYKTTWRWQTRINDYHQQQTAVISRWRVRHAGCCSVASNKTHRYLLWIRHHGENKQHWKKLQKGIEARKKCPVPTFIFKMLARDHQNCCFTSPLFLVNSHGIKIHLKCSVYNKNEGAREPRFCIDSKSIAMGQGRTQELMEGCFYFPSVPSPFSSLSSLPSSSPCILYPFPFLPLSFP